MFYIFFLQVVTAFDCSDMFIIQPVNFLAESKEWQQ